MLHVLTKLAIRWFDIERQNELFTVFPIKPWTPEKISGMFIVSRPIRSEMKPQKITDKPQQGSVTTWYETTSRLFLLQEIFNFPFGSLWKSYYLPQTNTSHLIPSVQKPNYRITLKCHYDENRIFSIEAILKHKQVAWMRRKLLFTVFKYLFLFQRYSRF